MNLENATSTLSLASPTSPLSAFDWWSQWYAFSSRYYGVYQIEGNSFGTDDARNKTFFESEDAACKRFFGSKLCKLFGLWLLTARRVEDNDDWKTYDARWEWIGRMLKFLFLLRTGYVFNVVAWSCQLTFLFYLNNSETNPLIIACPIHLK